MRNELGYGCHLPGGGLLVFLKTRASLEVVCVKDQSVVFCLIFIYLPMYLSICTGS